MYKGFILSESLNNPLLLNKLEKIYVLVEHHPGESLPYWNDYKVKIDDENIEQIANEIADNIKEGWYAHFWNDEEVIAVLPGKYFKIPKEEKWQSPQFKEYQEYGRQHGVEEQYLDGFWIQESDTPEVQEQ
ncbi:hypothetical protein A2617_00460 [Candidatus Daviesbacteria bacterium RIFOXYD1_FULL_41_10]|uniref:Uncharacterized protein n=2 Tax=Candidatus Daviesiibacteriota TaxID=1752718 RepID=A0A1F5N042_9BACT|nr:MAG: hypothetical protein UU67_C0007G0015 [Candidatus Daviesbacteria bacterium GW2011_GWB1_41_5]OGE71007.1 MAG: hypothetical protein A2617_00460 [Candidatus Daviesbacteria bacterium RIFOXYD1_FULL_41_10]